MNAEEREALLSILTLPRAYNPVLAADGTIFVASDLGGAPQVHRLDHDRLSPTAGADRSLPVAAVPGGLLFRHDAGGNETWQLSLLEGGGPARRLTRDERAIHASVVVAPDGRCAGLAYNPGGQADFRLGVIDLETCEIEDWLAEPGLWTWQSWHPGGEVAAVLRELSPTATRAFLLHRGGRLAPVLPDARMVDNLEFDSAGRLYALTNHGRDLMGLVEVDPREPSRPLRWILAPEAEVEAFRLDPTGRRAAVAVNRGAYDELAMVDLQTGETAVQSGLPAGRVHMDNVAWGRSQMAWSGAGDRLLVAWETPTRPTEVYELPGRRLTWASGEDRQGLAVPEEISFRSFDGLEIPALHYRVDGQPRPAVVIYHGGPEGQSRAGFNPVIHLLNGAGLDVLCPNVRGSTGYGVRFHTLDDREKRWDAVRDGCEAARHLLREGKATRLAAYGGSYGGFMTLAVLVEDPTLWSAAVDVVGIADWHTFLKNTSSWRRALRVAEYGDPDGAEAEALREFSPLRRAHEMRCPLLVIHGRNDVRVPVSEAEQIAAAAAAAELMIFDDEGHGIVKHRNRLRAYGRALDFLVEHLAPAPRAPQPAG